MHIKIDLKSFLVLAVVILLFCPIASCKAKNPDRDNDGVPDADEISIYRTDPLNPDTDGDGYKDWYELNMGFSPLSKSKLKLDKIDIDKDGLSDSDELRFHSNLKVRDTDSDGFSDGDEIKNGFDPLMPGNVKLPKKILINTKMQVMEYYLGSVRMGSYKVSTGKATTPTPKGTFRVVNKSPKAWSRPYGLWMPYWIGVGSGKFGIHELPIWPGGKREGSNHLGMPVSHGCIRLGVGPAKTIYDWTDSDTQVKIE
jgi:hypothetical protein